MSHSEQRQVSKFAQSKKAKLKAKGEEEEEKKGNPHQILIYIFVLDAAILPDG